MIVSLKVLAPAILGILTGFGLLVSGVIAKDPTLKTAGVSVIGAALLQAGVGFQVPHATAGTEKAVGRRRPSDRPS